MTKKELMKNFEDDFKLSKGALTEVITHNREIAISLSEDLLQGDFKKLEESIEINKLIMDGIKGFNDLYKNTPTVLDSIAKLSEDDEKDVNKPSLKDIMGDLD